MILSVILTVLVFGMYKNNREHWEGMLDDPATFAWQDQGNGTWRMKCFTEKVSKGKYSLEAVSYTHLVRRMRRRFRQFSMWQWEPMSRSWEPDGLTIIIS